MKNSSNNPVASLSRREALYGLGAGLGALAFSSMLQAEGQEFAGVHHPAKAKRCIFLMMEGGPSHIDTFDPKPELNRLHLQKFNREGDRESAMSSGERYFVKSPFGFIKAGKCGADISTEWNHLKNHVDDLCFYRGCQVESVNHPTACYHLNTGNRFGGDPAVGAWVTYGLGTLNDNLPGFVVLPRNTYPQGGASNWSNGFLPADHQGTPLRSEGSPILDLNLPAGLTREEQRRNLNLLNVLNREHLDGRANQNELESRMSSYELAYRMQMEVPGIINLDGESEKIKEAYGIGNARTDSFGRKCLLARRLVEKGVRFVQAYAGNWDSHDYISRAHGSLIKSVDKPIAALLADLKQRGLLEDTLVVWCGEFGRTPDNGLRGGGTSYGRDHNPKAMTMWFAGGGTKAGHTVGATDEIGAEAVDCVHHIRDIHCTWLHLMGLNDNKLSFYHAGRHKQLSQFGGQIIKEIIA